MTRRTCTSSGCIEPPEARGLCSRHYQRQIKAGEGSTFGAALCEAMTARGVSRSQLSAMTGVADSTIAYWRSGDRLPTIERADHIAELLDWDQLRVAIVAALSRRCARCRKRFLADARNRNHSKYCGATCRTAVARHGFGDREKLKNRRMLTKHERAVAAFCNDCEPLGLCRDSTCRLRTVSQLPFVPLTAVTFRRKAA